MDHPRCGRHRRPALRASQHPRQPDLAAAPQPDDQRISRPGRSARHRKQITPQSPTKLSCTQWPAGSPVLSDPSGSVENVIKGARFTEADAEAHVHGIAFKTGPPERVGVELEWLVRDPREPARPVRAEQVAAALAPFEGGTPASKPRYPQPEQRLVRNQIPAPPPGCTLTVEPAGPLELSSAPAVTLGALVEVTGRDLPALRDAAAAAGLELCGCGLDPPRAPRRQLVLA